MGKVVLDASAILAAAHREPGADIVLRHLDDSVVSTVNLAEVQGKLVGRGLTPDEAWEAGLSFCSEVLPFDAQHARIASGLVASTRSIGLSLGDRACIALAMLLKLPVYTTDRLWKKLPLSVEIRLLR